MDTDSWTGTEGERVRGRGDRSDFGFLARFSVAGAYYTTTHIEKIDSRAIYCQLKGILDFGIESKLDDSPDSRAPRPTTESGAAIYGVGGSRGLP